MKSKALSLLLLVPLTLTLPACVISVDGDGHDNHQSDWQDREYKNRKNIQKLSTAMSLGQVRDRMGVADFNERFERGDKSYQVLFFRTQRNEDDGMTTKDECTPLVFLNEELVGWGEAAYQDALSH